MRTLPSLDILATNTAFSIVVTSAHIIISVKDGAGIEKEFMAHEDLLAIHSEHFRQWLEDRKSDFKSPELSNIGEKMFAVTWNIPEFCFFMAWLYTGSLLETELFTNHELTGKLWDLGGELGAPGFRNCVMELIRKQYGEAKSKNHYMDIDTIKGIYTTTKKDTAPRCLAVDIMVKLQVLDNPKYGPKKDWENLLGRFPELKVDYDFVCNEEGIGSGNPWNAKNRARYLVGERSLDDMWEERILEKDNRTYEEREGDTEVGKMLEFEHLKMMKEKKNGKAEGPVK